MKPIILPIAVLLLGLSSLAAAEPVSQRAQHLADQLDLDQTQIEAVDKLITEHRDSMREQMSSQDLRGPERLEQMQASRAALHADIRKLLTPDQAEEFDRMVAQRRDMMAERQSDRQGMRGKHRGGRHGMMRDGRHGMSMGPCDGAEFEPDFSKLDLSEGMRARLEAMHEAHRAEMMEMHKRHREEMRELIGDEKFEQFKSEGMPCRQMDDDAADQAAGDDEEQG